MVLPKQIFNPKNNDLYTYIQKSFNEINFANWRNSSWWENEEWKHFIPMEEHHRFKKFRNQACRIFNKGNMEGYHFVEMLEMINLKKNGYQWLYENYYLFKNAGPNAIKFSKGTEIIKKIIGISKIEKLHNIVSSERLKPTEPDLFAYKRNDNCEDKFDMMFIEVKKDDILRENQLSGFKLIKSYLNIEIREVRYVLNK